MLEVTEEKTVITIDESAKIESYAFGWCLIQRRKQRKAEKLKGGMKGNKKDGGESWSTTYHPTPAMALKRYFLDTGKESKDLKEYLDCIEKVYDKLEKLVSNLKSQGFSIHNTGKGYENGEKFEQLRSSKRVPDAPASRGSKKPAGASRSDAGTGKPRRASSKKGS